jgi:hypothetical protein
VRVRAAEQPEDSRHDEVAEDDARDRREHHRDDDLVEDALPLHRGASGERRATEAADESL